MDEQLLKQVTMDARSVTSSYCFTNYFRIYLCEQFHNFLLCDVCKRTTIAECGMSKREESA